MARGKKVEKALTKEERLEQALVPKEMQSYPVPENWCWTRIGSITEVVSGGTPSTSVAEYYENGTIPWLSPADLSGYHNVYIFSGAKNITALGLEKSSAQMMPKDTVCLSSRAPIGYVVIAGNPLCTNQGFKSFLPSCCYIPKYLYWYLRGNKELLESYASGTTFLELSGKKAALVEFPLAPLPEQQRIVDCIDDLFTRLDEIKVKVQAVMDGYELRKEAILHKAFTGKLTERWRGTHGVKLDSWKRLKFGDIGEVITGSTPSTKHSEYYNGDIPFIKPTELNQGRNVSISAETLTSEGRDVSRPVRAGATSVCCIGATISKCGFLIVDCVTNQQINSIVPYDFMDDVFVYYYCCSKEFKESLIENSSATTLPIINKKKMSELKVVVPSKAEQAAISTILDRLFAKEQCSQNAALAVLNQIEIMKKAIIARAFRGKLGTNNLSEESAVELVKKVL